MTVDYHPQPAAAQSPALAPRVVLRVGGEAFYEGERVKVVDIRGKLCWVQRHRWLMLTYTSRLVPAHPY